MSTGRTIRAPMTTKAMSETAMAGCAESGQLAGAPGADVRVEGVQDPGVVGRPAVVEGQDAQDDGHPDAGRDRGLRQRDASARAPVPEWSPRRP